MLPTSGPRSRCQNTKPETDLLPAVPLLQLCDSPTPQGTCHAPQQHEPRLPPRLPPQAGRGVQFTQQSKVDVKEGSAEAGKLTA